MRGREGVRGVTGIRERFSPRGWYAAVVAVMVEGIPLVTAAHAPAAVRYQVTHTIPVGNGPHAVAVDPAARTVYVANSFGNSVSVIDEAASTPTATIPVGSNPDGVAVDPAAHTAYVPNFFGNSVSVISRCM